jgi:hypothetical protein
MFLRKIDGAKMIMGIHGHSLNPKRKENKTQQKGFMFMVFQKKKIVYVYGRFFF